MVQRFRGWNTCLSWPPEDQGWRGMEFCFPDGIGCYGMELSFASTLICPTQQLLYLFVSTGGLGWWYDSDQS
jgi:hypothetical protein